MDRVITLSLGSLIALTAGPAVLVAIILITLYVLKKKGKLGKKDKAKENTEEQAKQLAPKTGD